METDDTTKPSEKPTPKGPAGTANKPKEPGWHADPFGRFERRWWDGTRWSEKVSTGRSKSLDPPGINTAPAQINLDEPAPADPITDATLPIKAPSPWKTITNVLGIIVLVGLVILIVLFATGAIAS